MGRQPGGHNRRKSGNLKIFHVLSLCDACHNKMHNRETGELSELGKQWTERVSPPLPNSFKLALRGPGGGTLSNRASSGKSFFGR